MNEKYEAKEAALQRDDDLPIGAERRRTSHIGRNRAKIPYYTK